MRAKLSSRLFSAGDMTAEADVDDSVAKCGESVFSESTSAGGSVRTAGEEAGSLQSEDVDMEDARATEPLQAGGEPEAENNEQDENGDPLIEAAPCPAPAERGTTGPDNTTSRKRTAPSQTGDGQAKRRAMKRYREDAGGQWVKGRAGDDGEWIPEPGAPAFASLEAAVAHERDKTLLRRASWANLRGDVASTKKTVKEEALETRLHQSREAEATRQSVDSARDALAAQIKEGVVIMCPQRPARPANATCGIAFYSDVFTNLRAQDIKDLLASHGVQPVGTKTQLAQLVVAHLCEEDVAEFVAARSKRPRTGARAEDTSGGPVSAGGQQCTLDALLVGAQYGDVGTSAA